MEPLGEPLPSVAPQTLVNGVTAFNAVISRMVNAVLLLSPVGIGVPPFLSPAGSESRGGGGTDPGAGERGHHMGGAVVHGAPTATRRPLKTPQTIHPSQDWLWSASL